MFKTLKNQHFKAGGNLKRIGCILLAALVITGSFVMGGLVKETSFAATGNLSSTEGLWFGGASDNNATITVKQAGKYRFNVTGQGKKDYFGQKYGGNITGICYLNSGDVLKVSIIEGGAGGKYGSSTGQQGGSAIIIYINNKPLIGAGGAGGGYASRGQASIDILDAESVTLLNNSKFSSGGGGGANDGGSSKLANGNPGKTITGCTAATAGTHGAGGAAGANYMDQSVMNYVEMTNDSTEVSFKVEYIKATESDSYDSMAQIAVNTNGIAQIATNTNRIATVLENQGGNETIEESTMQVVNVVAGQSFAINVNGKLDRTGSFTTEGVTVIENSTEDNFLYITGTINSTGARDLLFSNTIIPFNVIEEPNSANIEVIIH